LSALTISCPYCAELNDIELPETFAPIFVTGHACHRYFIAERRTNDVAVMTENEAPCMSNPECREVKTSATCAQTRN
jgi:sarcosine oxidase delta subunit